MKDQYVGDVGDFCKYGLLYALFGRSNLTLGVNWYYTPDDNGKDGKLTTPPNLRICLPELDDKLTELKKASRALASIEYSEVLPKTSIFYRDLVGENASLREQWHRSALGHLKTADVVFLDPDNGIATEKMEQRSRTNKSAYRDEIVDYYLSGKSVIVYNHCSHQHLTEYGSRFERVYRMIPGCFYHRIRSHRGTARDYCFFIQPAHKKDIELALNGFLSDASPWKRYKHFSDLTDEDKRWLRASA